MPGFEQRQKNIYVQKNETCLYSSLLCLTNETSPIDHDLRAFQSWLQPPELMYNIWPVYLFFARLTDLCLILQYVRSMYGVLRTQTVISQPKPNPKPILVTRGAPSNPFPCMIFLIRLCQDVQISQCKLKNIYLLQFWSPQYLTRSTHRQCRVPLGTNGKKSHYSRLAIGICGDKSQTRTIVHRI